jgi:hypothetical protein
MDRYVDFLIGTPKQYSGVELSRVSPEEMSHDSVSRWLSDERYTPKVLWQESQHMVELDKGYLVIDDSVLDKPYAMKMDLVKYQYSGKHHDVVKGIGLINLLWTKGDQYIPVDYRIYAPENDGKTKNDHAREMLSVAKKREFQPKYVLMDSWYTNVGNLKAIDAYTWKWIGALKSNRLVSQQKGTYISVADLDWTATPAHTVWLKGYGFVLVVKITAKKGRVDYIATNDLSLNDETIQKHWSHRWTIETFHRGIKQTTGIEKCQSRNQRAQRNHILAAFLAFLRLEWERIQDGISWYEQKNSITRAAVTHYMN